MEGSKPKIGKVNSKFKVVWPDGTETRLGLNQERDEDGAALLTPRLGESTRTTNGIELVLERVGGPWLPLHAGTVYAARVQKISGANTPLPPNIMILSLGPKLVARLPELKIGMPLRISTATLPNVSKASVAIGGGPALVRNGKTLAQPIGRNEIPEPLSAGTIPISFLSLSTVEGKTCLRE